jgi:hypothetical protein
MRTCKSLMKAIVLAGIATLVATASASAQAWHYPTLQTPDISTRDFTFLVAGGGDYGTSGVVEWREGIAPDAHIGVDFGIATPGSTTLVLAGVGLGYGLMKSTHETPIDLILTGGLYGAFGDHSEIRIPVGVVAGHHFPLAGALVLTPFVAPRLSVDVCGSDCGRDDTHLKLNFDIGASLDVTHSVAIRSALTIGGVGGGPSRTSFGIGLTYRPNMAPRR